MKQVVKRAQELRIKKELKVRKESLLDRKEAVILN